MWKMKTWIEDDKLVTMIDWNTKRGEDHRDGDRRKRGRTCGWNIETNMWAGWSLFRLR
jgi:hypothetical protein